MSLFKKNKHVFSCQPKDWNYDDLFAHSNNNDMNNASNKAIIYRSELDYLSRCILDYKNIETGGQLFGYWTSLGVPVVLYAIGPGKHAQHNYTSFVQDQDYLQKIGNKLHEKYRLQHIGEWHSHHQLGLAHPSGGDVNTMQYGVGKPGFPRLLLCIGNCTNSTSTINPFNFHESDPHDYRDAYWDIVELDSPYRAIIDRDLNHILIHPATSRPSHGNIQKPTVDRESSEQVIHWLFSSPEHIEVMKVFVSMVKDKYPSGNVRTEINKTGEPQIAIKDINYCIKLPLGFPTLSPVCINELTGAVLELADVKWNSEDDALKPMFQSWVDLLFENLNAKDLTENEMDL